MSLFNQEGFNVTYQAKKNTHSMLQQYCSYDCINAPVIFIIIYKKLLQYPLLAWWTIKVKPKFDLQTQPLYLRLMRATSQTIVFSCLICNALIYNNIATNLSYHLDTANKKQKKNIKLITHPSQAQIYGPAYSPRHEQSRNRLTKLTINSPLHLLSY